MSSARCSFHSPLHHLSLLLLLLLAMLLVHRSVSMDLDQLCEFRCNIGRGGELCKCNAFHFAGKRSDDNEGSDSASSSPYFLDFSAGAFSGRKYRNANGGLSVSGSGGGEDEPFAAAEAKLERRGGEGEMVEAGGEAGVRRRKDLVVEGEEEEIAGGERRRLALRSLSSLLRKALSKRLVSERGAGNIDTPEWQDSSFPFIPDDDTEY
ncbi:uncharacterized protein LOC143276694 [Babylonia areolata]|uniref:uncharacterized protein LOC143276694 n=1 Tax=Babylonia areolata TaxID=304850 RepID=UPI003FD59F38